MCVLNVAEEEEEVVGAVSRHMDGDGQRRRRSHIHEYLFLILSKQ